MILKIKNRIEEELKNYTTTFDKIYGLNRISGLLYTNITEFISRSGKRVRPILFCLGYLGFKNRPPAGFYRSALSMELIHDFLLVHDDIIDRSLLRRGKPSMHAKLNKYLKGLKNVKFTGEDLGIVIGDVMYAMALDAFMSIKENPLQKEKALKKLIAAGLYTGAGEFIELIYGASDIEKITPKDIYNIYDLKTANYTFSFPLTTGATLAGADEKEIKLLFDYGNYLGRAFQIKDDIIGIFSSESEIGKSNLTDLQEAKKTILIWHAFHHTNRNGKITIKSILDKKDLTTYDLHKMRKIITEAGTLLYADKEIQTLVKKAKHTLNRSKMSGKYKNILNNYISEILKL